MGLVYLCRGREAEKGKKGASGPATPDPRSSRRSEVAAAAPGARLVLPRGHVCLLSVPGSQRVARGGRR